jgi:prepilin-type N-terminal cleavage/methylation domain-containing protein
MDRLRQIRGDDGFTLIEVLVAMVVILVGVLGTVMLVDRASAGSSDNKARAQATSVARNLSETAQGLSYSTVTSSAGLVTTMQSSGFPDWDTATTGWQLCTGALGLVKSGTTACAGIVVTVTATECSVDDPHDGSGVHGAGTNFCSDSAAGTTDSNPDDYKRMSFTVTPPTGISQPVTQTTIVGAYRASSPGGGGGGGGATVDVTALTITSPTLVLGQVAPCTSNLGGCTWPQVTSTTVAPKTVTFQATTASAAQKVKFAVDGQVMATVNGPATSFTWSWALPNAQPDGVYNVTAQVFDSTGNTAQGDPKPLSVTINRYVPDYNAFTVASAGRNHLYPLGASSTPEIETYPSAGGAGRVDRDIAGFMIARQVGNNGTIVCTTTSVLIRWCQDTTAPAPSGNTAMTYDTGPYGYYPNGTQAIGNAGGVSSNVNAANARPCNPSSVQLTRAGSVVTFTWTNPGICSPGTTASGDPNAGDCVDFFRVYSKPTSDLTAFKYSERVDRTPFGNPVSPCGANSTEQSNGITLWENDSTTKRYQITSVDRSLDESTGVIVSG